MSLMQIMPQLIHTACDCHVSTRSVWPTLWVKIARRKVGVNRHFQASWASHAIIIIIITIIMFLEEASNIITCCNVLAGSERALKGDRVSPLECHRQLLEQVDGLNIIITITICNIIISSNNNFLYTTYLPSLSDWLFTHQTADQSSSTMHTQHVFTSYLPTSAVTYCCQYYCSLLLKLHETSGKWGLIRNVRYTSFLTTTALTNI